MLADLFLFFERGDLKNDKIEIKEILNGIKRNFIGIIIDIVKFFFNSTVI